MQKFGTNSLPKLNIVILDFLYGVATYNCWKSASSLGMMEEYWLDATGTRHAKVAWMIE